MRDIKLKLWSLLFATCIAYFVNSQSNAGVVTFVVPVELQNLPPQKAIILSTENQAQVKLRGPSHLLSSVGANPPSFKLRAPEAPGNRFRLALNEDAIELPPGIQVQGIDPPEIEFVLDDIESKELPVVVPKIGEVVNSLRLEEILINPKRVMVTGPGTELKDLKIIETLPLDMREIRQTATVKLGLRRQGKFSKIAAEVVDVTIVISSLEKEREFTSLPVEIRSTQASSYKSMPNSVKIEVSGAVETIDGLSKADLVPYVRIDEGPQDSLRRVVAVDLPDGVSLVQIDPKTVLLMKVVTGDNNQGPAS